MFIDLFEHIAQKLMEIDGAIAVFVHFLQLGVNFLFVHVVPEPSEQKLEGSAGDVAGVVAVVHFEDLLELLDLLDFVGVEVFVFGLLAVDGAEAEGGAVAGSLLARRPAFHYRNY